MLRLLLLRWFAARTLGGVVAGALGATVPIAIALKLVGVPLLAAVGLVGAPVGVVLALLRLPRLIVLGVSGVVGTLAAAAFMLGVIVLKVVLVACVAWFVVRWLRRRSRGDEPVTAAPII